MSRMMVLARLISLMICAGAVCLRTAAMVLRQRSIWVWMSFSISSSLASMAAVRMMTPKFLGSTAAAMRFRRFFSSAERIFCERKTLEVKGTSTTLRPASEMSAVRRGPLVEIASLAIWTMTVWPTWRKSPILPFLSMGASSFMPSTRRPRLPGCCEAMTFCSEGNWGPRSR